MDFREPWSYHRSPPSYKLKEADLFTQIGPSHTHENLIGAVTNSEKFGSYRQVAKG